MCEDKATVRAISFKIVRTKLQVTACNEHCMLVSFLLMKLISFFAFFPLSLN